MKDEREKDAAEYVPQDVAHDLAFGAWQRASSSPRHHRRHRCLCAARAEMRVQLGSSVAYIARGENDSASPMPAHGCDAPYLTYTAPAAVAAAAAAAAVAALSNTTASRDQHPRLRRRRRRCPR